MQLAAHHLGQLATATSTNRCWDPANVTAMHTSHDTRWGTCVGNVLDDEFEWVVQKLARWVASGEGPCVQHLPSRLLISEALCPHISAPETTRQTSELHHYT